jgi:predicted nuclease with RNAse H fold
MNRRPHCWAEGAARKYATCCTGWSTACYEPSLLVYSADESFKCIVVQHGSHEYSDCYSALTARVSTDLQFGVNAMKYLASRTVSVGVDVGGPRKGFLAVALQAGDVVSTFSSCHAKDIATWCRQISADVVGVGAPVAWSKSGRARPAERALMDSGIWCFSTPRKEAADRHPTNHYAWMLNGAELYTALSKNSFNRFDGINERQRPICFETFPHAVCCALAARVVPARKKRTVRRALLVEAGVSCDQLTNIDLIDAALCALTADHFSRRRFSMHGDAKEGFIVVPSETEFTSP